MRRTGPADDPDDMPGATGRPAALTDHPARRQTPGPGHPGASLRDALLAIGGLMATLVLVVLLLSAVRANLSPAVVRSVQEHPER